MLKFLNAFFMNSRYIESMNWADLHELIISNIRSISVAVGGLVLVLALAAGAVELKNRKEASAVTALYEARQEIEANKNIDLAGKVAALTKVADSHSGTRAAYEALLEIGDLHMDNKDYDAGISAYGQAVDAATEPFARVLARYNKATAQEIAQKCVEAIPSYAAVLAEPSAEFLKPEVLMAQARCNEQAGNNTAAIDLYQKLQDEFSDKAYYANSASVYLQKLKKRQKN